MNLLDMSTMKLNYLMPPCNVSFLGFMIYFYIVYDIMKITYWYSALQFNLCSDFKAFIYFRDSLSFPNLLGLFIINTSILGM